VNNRNILTILLAGLIIISSSVFIVDEREIAIKFRLGEIVKTYDEPGIFLMIPFLNNIKKYDSRLLTMDSKPEQFLTSEKKNVIVDSYVKWKITDPQNFYRSSKGDERIGINRLSQIINDLTKSEFSKRTIDDVVSGDRVALMNTVRTEAK
jgi:Membrane protease subunits, stomatin/prohibitin homologs